MSIYASSSIELFVVSLAIATVLSLLPLSIEW